MSYSNYPRGFPFGIVIRGIPLTQAHPGKVFWVHNASTYVPDGGIAGNNGNPGTFQKPFASVAYADDQAQSGRGDIIMVMPGYTETLLVASTASTGIHLETNQVAVIGLGVGDHRPKIAMNNANADINMAGESQTLYNFIFDTGIININSVDVNNKDCVVSGCKFGGAATQAPTSSITVSGVDEAYIENNEFQLLISSSTGAAMTDTAENAIELTDSQGTTIIGNTIMGDFTVAAIEAVSTACRGLTIRDNLIHNVATENIAGGIDLVDGCTGMITDNVILLVNATGGPATMIDAASCSNMRNWGNDALGEATWPILIGTAAAAT